MPEKIALLSDIHGNTPALRAVLKDIERERCSRIYVLGDIINGVDPKSCVELIRSLENVVCIRGNAEAYLLTPDLEEFPQRHEPLYADLISVLCWWVARLSKNEMEWLEQCPDTWRWNGTYLVHDSPFDRLHVEEGRTPGVEQNPRELVHHGKGTTLRTSDYEFAELFACMETQKLSGIFFLGTHTNHFADGRATNSFAMWAVLDLRSTVIRVHPGSCLSKSIENLRLRFIVSITASTK